MYSYGPPHMAVQKQDNQHEHTFSNYVRIRDVVQKTCLRRWTIGKSGERGSGISVLPARHDYDDDEHKMVAMSLNNKPNQTQQIPSISPFTPTLVLLFVLVCCFWSLCISQFHLYLHITYICYSVSYSQFWFGYNWYLLHYFVLLSKEIHFLSWAFFS